MTFLCIHIYYEFLKIYYKNVQIFSTYHILDNQKKLGFVTPISEWLRKHPAEIIEAILLTPKCEARGIFDMAKVRQIVDKHLSGRRDYGALIFRWLTTEIWFQEFIDNPETKSAVRALDSTVVSR